MVDNDTTGDESAIPMGVHDARHEAVRLRDEVIGTDAEHGRDEQTIDYQSLEVMSTAVAGTVRTFEGLSIRQFRVQGGPRSDTGGAAISVFFAVSINDGPEINVDAYSGSWFGFKLRDSAPKQQRIRKIKFRNRQAVANGTIHICHGDILVGGSNLD